MSLESALLIESGEELLHFDLGTVCRDHKTYTVITGYEVTPGICFWCGQPLKGKLKRYCYGHMELYYKHFEWGSASRWARQRAGGKCENCGQLEGHRVKYSIRLEVHHIVPLSTIGYRPEFSAYHLPWNLVALCHECHLEIHAIMRPPAVTSQTKYDRAISAGQISFLERR